MDTSIPQKRCSKCKQEWPATTEYFCNRSNRPGGLGSQCKRCDKAKRALKHPPKLKEILPDGYKRCTSCLTLLPATPEFFYRSTRYGLSWFCKSCVYTRMRVPKNHPPTGFRVCTGCHEMKPATLEFFRKSKRPVGLDTKCKLCRSEARKQYFREHTEQRTKNVIRSRRYKDIPGILTPQQIQDKLRLQRYRCYYCNAGFEKRNGGYIFHLEHTIPISRSEYNPRHDINYVVLACHSCNESKRDKLPHEWPNGGRLL